MLKRVSFDDRLIPERDETITLNSRELLFARASLYRVSARELSVSLNKLRVNLYTCNMFVAYAYNECNSLCLFSISLAAIIQLPKAVRYPYALLPKFCFVLRLILHNSCMLVACLSS